MGHMVQDKPDPCPATDTRWVDNELNTAEMFVNMIKMSIKSVAHG